MRQPHRFILLCITLASLYLPASIHAKQPTEKPQEQKTAPLPKTFDAKTHTLDNGLEIIVVENHRAPVVTHMLWYKVGAADEPRGKSGIAHFFEHLMFKGQKHEQLGALEAGEFSKIVRSIGGQDNAFTSQDYTAYYQSVPKEHLKTVMRMEAGRMTALDVNEESFESEKKVIMEERRQRTDNDPRAQMAEQLREALFPNHPYSIPVIGWMHEIEGLTWDDAKAFYDLYYAPNNAILIVAGDVTKDEVVTLAKQTYGLIPSAETPKRIRTKSPPFIANSAVTLEHDSIKQPVFRRIYRMPSARQNKQDALALEVLSDIIGNGSTTRLYKALVIEQKLATSLSLSYHSSAWDDATLTIAAIPAASTTIENLEHALDEQLREIVQNGISEDELNQSIKRMQAEAIYARDSLSGPAMVIGYALTTGSALDDIEYWPHNLNNVTQEQLQDVANRYLNPDQPSKTPPVTGILLPKAQKQERAQ